MFFSHRTLICRLPHSSSAVFFDGALAASIWVVLCSPLMCNFSIPEEINFARSAVDVMYYGVRNRHTAAQVPLIVDKYSWRFLRSRECVRAHTININKQKWPTTSASRTSTLRFVTKKNNCSTHRNRTRKIERNQSDETFWFVQVHSHFYEIGFLPLV